MKRDGFSLIELLVTVAIAGVLLGSTVVMLRNDGVSTSQAARVLAANLSKTRFEAIESNRTAYLAIDSTGFGAYTVWVDEDEDGARADSEIITRVQFGVDDLNKVKLTSRNLPAGGAIRFDRRGIPLDALATTVLTLASEANSVDVALSTTGRPDIR